MATNSKSKKKRKLDQEIDLGEFLGKIFAFFVIVGSISFILYCYFNVYNPEKQAFIKGSEYAYDQLQTKVQEIYNERKYIFKTEGETEDEICKHFLSENLKDGGNCMVGKKTGIIRRNFTFRKTKIDILGFEQPAFEMGGTLVKDIMIDVDGELKGENTVGKDRIPVRIHSTGRLGGLVTPVNCSTVDLKDYDFDKSLLCIGAEEINYLGVNEPFGYDVAQIGGDKGKTRLINRNVPLLRADCMAFGGDMFPSDGYCDAKRYPWLAACYDEFPCSVRFSYKKLKKKERK